MKVSLLAGLIFGLAVSVSAGGAGGPGGDVKTAPTGNGGQAGNGGSNGPVTAGKSQAGNGGNTGAIGGGTMTGTTGNGGNGGSVSTGVSGITGANVVFGGLGGGNFAPTLGGGMSNGAASGTNSFGSDYRGLNNQAGSGGNSQGGSAWGGIAGTGGQGGNTGNVQSGNRAGTGGQGGEATISPTLSVPIPARKRSMDAISLVARDPKGPIPLVLYMTDKEIIDAVQHNQRLPDPLEAELPLSALGSQYNIPTNRSPVNPHYAKMDCSLAIKELKANRIPAPVVDAINKAWPKKNGGHQSPAGPAKANNVSPHPAPVAAKAVQAPGPGPAPVQANAGGTTAKTAVPPKGMHVPIPGKRSVAFHA